ncbi:MAG: sugar transferase [Clostridia bacterium]|jgi:undecaprenyl phosphate N,N'-diacetylbacillosamine 1-phosphate transferase|nr:sugar transferase [Clostridia bacterium]
MYRFFKAVMDFLLALLGLVILFFPLLIVALAIRIDSKGPAIFKQERIGKGQKPFMLYKFRTMKTTNVEFDINHPVIKDDNKNLTRVGRVIRKLKIDEFLQLINVLKGDMSLIGPRPLMRVYLDGYEPWEKQKFNVRPGMSGLSQVKGNGHLSSVERSYYDVIYAKKQNLFKDTEILFKTIGVMLAGEEKFLTPVSAEKINEMRTQFSLDNIED